MAKKINRLEAYEMFSQEERRRVAQRTGNNEKALAKFDEMANRDRQRIASHGLTSDEKRLADINEDEKERRRRAVRTGGQW